jgi:multiple sugar transport system ATP-binding protein
MAEVLLQRVDKVYPGGVHAVRTVDLTVHDHEFVVLVGPSGCGKSTLLRLIAGLETLTGGDIYIGGRLVSDLPPKDRDIAMVFQSYALYPHLNVFDNMALGLKLRKVPAHEIRRRVGEAAAILGIEALLDRRPRQRSGGQRQRVAVGRAIVRKPQVFLFDEPLSNLDAKMRVQTRAEIGLLHRRLQATIVYVTHDQTEAMTMGNRIVVMQDGWVRQVGTPLEVYRQPADRFVAGFIGSPSMNVLRGRWVQDGGLHLALEGGGRVDFEPDPGLDVTPGAEIDLGVRPEHLGPGTRPGDWRRAARLEGELTFVEPLGSETFLHAAVGPHTVIARVPRDLEVQVGAKLTLWLDLDRCHAFDPTTGAPRALRRAAAGARPGSSPQ